MTRARSPQWLAELPTVRMEMAKLRLDLSRLDPDSAKGCPISMADIRRYVVAETGRRGHDYFFGRTALVDDVSFWLWGIIDAGACCYIDVSAARGAALIGMGSGEGLTPEQFIALRYACQWRGKAR